MADTVTLMTLADELHKDCGTATTLTYSHASFTQEASEVKLKLEVEEVSYETL